VNKVVKYILVGGVAAAGAYALREKFKRLENNIQVIIPKFDIDFSDAFKMKPIVVNATVRVNNHTDVVANVEGVVVNLDHFDSNSEKWEVVGVNSPIQPFQLHGRSENEIDVKLTLPLLSFPLAAVFNKTSRKFRLKVNIFSEGFEVGTIKYLGK